MDWPAPLSMKGSTSRMWANLSGAILLLKIQTCLLKTTELHSSGKTMNCSTSTKVPSIIMPMTFVLPRRRKRMHWSSVLLMTHRTSKERYDRMNSSQMMFSWLSMNLAEIQWSTLWLLGRQMWTRLQKSKNGVNRLFFHLCIVSKSLSDINYISLLLEHKHSDYMFMWHIPPKIARWIISPCHQVCT